MAAPPESAWTVVLYVSRPRPGGPVCSVRDQASRTDVDCETTVATMRYLDTRAWAPVLLGGTMAMAVVMPRAGDCTAPATTTILTTAPTPSVTEIKGRPMSSGATDGGTTKVTLVPTPSASTEDRSWAASASEVVSGTGNFQTASATGTRIARAPRRPGPPIPSHYLPPPGVPKPPGHPKPPGPPLPPGLPLPPLGGFRNAMYLTNW